MQKTESAILILVLAAGLFLENGTHAARRQGAKQPDYLRIVKAYANAMIKDGRDTYGTEHSPLFASALDRRTMRLGDFSQIHQAQAKRQVHQPADAAKPGPCSSSGFMKWIPWLVPNVGKA